MLFLLLVLLLLLMLLLLLLLSLLLMSGSGVVLDSARRGQGLVRHRVVHDGWIEKRLLVELRMGIHYAGRHVRHAEGSVGLGSGSGRCRGDGGRRRRDVV